MKQKQEWIMSTPLRLIKSLEVAPMNMACFGGKDVKRDWTLVPNERRLENRKHIWNEMREDVETDFLVQFLFFESQGYYRLPLFKIFHLHSQL